MKNLIIAALAVAAACSSEASLVSRDYLTNGDGKLTYDSSTGLNWLDLSESRGMSLTDFWAGERGLNTSFRVANLAEMRGLMTGAGMSSQSWHGYDPASYAASLQLNSLIDSSGDTCSVVTSCGFFNWDINGKNGTGWLNLVANKSSDIRQDGGFVGFGRFQEVSMSNSKYGLMLIQKSTNSVPEPSSTALVALALASLGAVSRLRKKAV